MCKPELARCNFLVLDWLVGSTKCIEPHGTKNVGLLRFDILI